MKEDIIDRIEQPVKHWWLSTLVGIIALAIGVIVLINPVESYFAMAMWLGVVILLTGILSLVEALTTRNYFVRRGWVVVAAICDMIIGVVLMFNAMLSVAILPVLFGVWLLYRGFVTLAQGIDLRDKNIRDAGWVIFGSSLVIAISLAILLLPMSLGVVAVVTFVAVALIIYGLARISLGFRLAALHSR